MRIHGWKKINRYHWKFKNVNLHIYIKKIGYKKWNVSIVDGIFNRFNSTSGTMDKYTEAENYAIRKQKIINASIRS